MNIDSANNNNDVRCPETYLGDGELAGLGVELGGGGGGGGRAAKPHSHQLPGRFSVRIFEEASVCGHSVLVTAWFDWYRLEIQRTRLS